MPGDAVVIFKFPLLPDDYEKMAHIIEGSRRLFTDIPELSVHAAVNEVADKVMAALNENEEDGDSHDPV